jgi:hypothetical protein
MGTVLWTMLVVVLCPLLFNIGWDCLVCKDYKHLIVYFLFFET